MLRIILLILIAYFYSISSIGQQITNIRDYQPALKYENVHVYQMDSDPLVSTYLIWVKKSVAAHYHENHSEVVYVLEGEGEMTLGDLKRTIRPGDYIYIPKGTPHAVLVKSDSPMKVMSIQTPEFDGTDRVILEDN
jgi:mannose-6-phosphate isomerase-like protein (cupin superfamily)